MSFDLGGPAIEIAIALAFVFFLLSLIVTALTEWVAYALKLRSKTLKEGLEGMLGDKQVAAEILKHPLVRSDLRNKDKHPPSYVAPTDFAAVFRLLVDPPPASAKSSRATIRVSDEDGASSTHEITPKLDAQLRTLSGSAAAIPTVKALEGWFDKSMDRVSGWYKRRSQVVTVVIAVVVAVGLNVSALRVAEKLTTEPTVRAAVVAKAEAAAEKEEEPKGKEGLKQAGKNTEEAVKELGALKLPIFWAGENVPSGWGWGTTALGWAITIVAISLGAPFWFDTLGKLSNLRMAGRKPEADEKKG